MFVLSPGRKADVGLAMSDGNRELEGDGRRWILELVIVHFWLVIINRASKFVDKAFSKRGARKVDR